MPRSYKATSRKVRREERRTPIRVQAPIEVDFEEEANVSRGIKEPVTALNDAQRAYDKAISESRIVFGVGSAGTGKTWFAVMRACEALEAKKISKIYITRPAVEAGESMGFLPGDLDEKYEPYIRPVRDALDEKFGRSRVDYMLKKGIIEARPMAYLRGSTLKNAYILADEMQNATPTQMMMLLTRAGPNSKFLINGDPRQSDINGVSGLSDAVERLKGVHGINTVTFGIDDVVRDGIVASILRAYER